MDLDQSALGRCLASEKKLVATADDTCHTMNVVKEIWKQHPIYPHIYGSSLGNVKHIGYWVIQWNRFQNCRKWIKPHLYKVVPNNTGRDFITVSGKQIGRSVIVLECFVGLKPSPDLMCCHGDDNPLNNKPHNLRWDTHLSNQQEKSIRGRASKIFGEGNPLTRISNADVVTIKSSSLPYKELAKKFNTSKSQISRIKHGKSRQVK